MKPPAVLLRSMRFEASSSDGRTLTGLAVPFGVETRIDNAAEGRFDEQFVLGAFKRSIAMRTPKLQFEHGTHSTFGSLPIGSVEQLTETTRGLEVEARLFGADMFEPLREALQAGAIDGMSIRFRPLEVQVTRASERRDSDVELRSIVEAELIELGPVVWPAYASTKVELRSAEQSRRDRLIRLHRRRASARLTALETRNDLVRQSR